MKKIAVCFENIINLQLAVVHNQPHLSTIWFNFLAVLCQAMDTFPISKSTLEIIHFGWTIFYLVTETFSKTIMIPTTDHAIAPKIYFVSLNS